MSGVWSAVKVTFNILGSLALFLYAMRLLGQSLQNVIGERIEFVLRKLTDRPYKGMVVGALVTFLTQSSSITVLTLIGLVNVGVLSLRQGVGIVLGSEIGTTVTAQLMTLKIGGLYFPIIVIGFALATFSKNKNLNLVGKVIFSFGLLFMGMEFMKEAASPLKESPVSLALLKRFGSNPFLGILAGALFTGITSSSSATTSLVVAMGASNVIDLPAGIAVILGANIGTCLLELIAAVGLSLAAKRVAAAQAVINILGVIVIFPFISPFAKLMTHTAGTVSHQIANSHTIFNVASSVILLAFVNIIVYIVQKVVPGEGVQIERGTRYIDRSLLGMPHVALVNATKEIQRTGEMVLAMLDYVRKALLDQRDDFLEVIHVTEDQIDFLNEEISRYLAAISEREMDYRSSERLAQLLHGIADIERASDHLNRIAEQIEGKKKKRIAFSRGEKKDLAAYVDSCAAIFAKSLGIFIQEDTAQATEITSDLQELRTMERALLKARSSRWHKEKREVYGQALHHLERLANHADSLAQITVSGF